MECGGGFGGKIRALCEPITAILSRVTGRPVRYVMTRREELEAGMPAPQVIIKLKTGVKRDGTLMALDAETIIDSGAFSGAVLAVSAVFLGSMYKWPAFDIRGYEVLTHKPSVAAYRAPVAPQTIFAIDSQMEQIARDLGLDPVEFRMRHLIEPGDPMANGQPWQSNGAKQVLARIALHPHWKSRKEWVAAAPRGKRRGVGLGLGGWLGGLQPTGATVRLNPDGSLAVLTGQVDIAGTNIALAQIAASAFGVDTDLVRITTGDTDTAPVTGLSAGSKTIYTVGRGGAPGCGGRPASGIRDRGRGAGGVDPRSRAGGRQDHGARRPGQGHHARPPSARRATSTCRRRRPCSARRIRRSPSRRPPSRRSWRGSRSTRTPVR